MSGVPSDGPRAGALAPALAWTAGALVLAAVVLIWAAGSTASPGPYYDEAFLAQQARDFVVPERTGAHPPGTSAWEIFGRPFPLRNAAYLGALKSQLALPTLLAFGASLEVWRLTSLATALAAWIFTLLFARRVFGDRVAGIAGTLLLFDPCLLFFGLYEWGPFTTLFLCRAAGAFLLVEGWLRERRALLALAGGLLGLGVFARADFALVIFAAGLGALAARPELWQAATRARWRDTLLTAAAFLLASLPMWLSLGALFQTSQGIAGRGGLDYKAAVLWSTLDGSHFLRVLEVGGLFDEIFEPAAAASIFGVVFVASGLGLGAAALKKGSRMPRAERFLLVATPVVMLAMWLLPGAVRGHHSLNAMPLPHLVVALAAVRLLDAVRIPLPMRRAGVALVLIAVLASQLIVTHETRAFIERTGGRGRFSDAIQPFAKEMDAAAAAQPETRVVSLDWGFHEPLWFLTERVALHEPIWAIGPLLASGRAWGRQGDSATRYLVHDERYDLFGLSARFLDTARRLPRREVTIETRSDREGAPAFHVVRFAFPHQLVFDGAFAVKRR